MQRAITFLLVCWFQLLHRNFLQEEQQKLWKLRKLSYARSRKFVSTASQSVVCVTPVSN